MFQLHFRFHTISQIQIILTQKDKMTKRSKYRITERQRDSVPCIEPLKSWDGWLCQQKANHLSHITLPTLPDQPLRHRKTNNKTVVHLQTNNSNGIIVSNGIVFQFFINFISSSYTYFCGSRSVGAARGIYVLKQDICTSTLHWGHICTKIGM